MNSISSISDKIVHCSAKIVFISKWICEEWPIVHSYRFQIPWAAWRMCENNWYVLVKWDETQVFSLEKKEMNKYYLPLICFRISNQKNNVFSISFLWGEKRMNCPLVICEKGTQSQILYLQYFVYLNCSGSRYFVVFVSFLKNTHKIDGKKVCKTIRNINE